MRYVLGGDVWQIVQAGKQLTVSANGKPQVRVFRTPEQAAAQLDKLVADKLAAGFQPALDDPREPALEAAIAADPDNVAAYAVYGDWLESQGDPRGPLIALQLAARTGDAKLEAAAKKQLDAHADYFLGPLAQLAPDDLAWSLGFIHKAYLHSDRQAPLDEWVARVLTHPSARFLGELVLTGNSRATEAIAILAEHAPPTLRALRLSAMWAQDLGALWPTMPELRSLMIRGQTLALGELELPKLERLDILDTSFTFATIHAIAHAPWPALQQLKLDFGRSYLTGDASIDDVFALLARRDLRALTQLALVHTRYVRELVGELAASPLAPRLETLDLSHNEMTDVHALELVRHRAAFPQLQQLDVSGNRLTEIGLRALAEVAPKLRAVRQSS